MSEELNNLVDDILKEKLKLHYENEELEAQGKLIKELCKEIERLNKENKELEEIIGIRECQLEEMQQQKTDYTQVNILEMKLDKLHSIIKEVRDLANKEDFTMKQKYEMREELLEILRGEE